MRGCSRGFGKWVIKLKIKPILCNHITVPAQFFSLAKSLYFLNPARFLKVGSKIRFRIRRFSGVTSKSSSTSIKSMACSKLKILGGTRVSASSAEEERVLVRCFFLHTLISISSAREEEPITMPEYTFSPDPINKVPRSCAEKRP